MSMKVKRGVVLTPKRQRIVHAYYMRHNWLSAYRVGGYTPMQLWSAAERRALLDWEDGFGKEEARPGVRGERQRKTLGRDQARLPAPAQAVDDGKSPQHER